MISYLAIVSLSLYLRARRGPGEPCARPSFRIATMPGDGPPTHVLVPVPELSRLRSSTSMCLIFILTSRKKIFPTTTSCCVADGRIQRRRPALAAGRDGGRGRRGRGTVSPPCPRLQVVLGLGVLELDVEAVLNAHLHLDAVVDLRRLLHVAHLLGRRDDVEGGVRGEGRVEGRPGARPGAEQGSSEEGSSTLIRPRRARTQNLKFWWMLLLYCLRIVTRTIYLRSGARGRWGNAGSAVKGGRARGQPWRSPRYGHGARGPLSPADAPEPHVHAVVRLVRHLHVVELERVRPRRHELPWGLEVPHCGVERRHGAKVWDGGETAEQGAREAQRRCCLGSCASARGRRRPDSVTGRVFSCARSHPSTRSRTCSPCQRINRWCR